MAELYGIMADFVTKYKLNITDVDLSGNPLKTLISEDKVNKKLKSIWSLNLLDCMNFESIQMVVRQIMNVMP